MRAVIAVTCVTVLPATPAAHAKDTCAESRGKNYEDGIAFHLGKRGVPFTTGSRGGICVDESRSAELHDAQRQLEKYFYEVAYSLADSCEERAYVEWAKKEGLRFDVVRVLDARMRPKGSMLFLRSYTDDEVLSNRGKLASAPKQAKCPKAVK